MPRLQASAAYLRALDDNARALNGALVKVYANGTTTQSTTYSDAAMTIANPWPVIADAAGRFPDIYVAPGLYRIRIETAGGVLIDESDDNVVYGMNPGEVAKAKFKTVAILQADETMGYALGGNVTTIVTAGDIVEAGGLSYSVMASGVSDQDEATAGGVKLDRLATKISRADSVRDLIAIPRVKGVSVSVTSWHGNTYSIAKGQWLGGGTFTWQPDMPKANHDGGCVISPTVPYGGATDVWNGSAIVPGSGPSLAAFLAGTGETDASGTGCWVREIGDHVTPYMFGARGQVSATEIYDDAEPFEAALNNDWQRKVFFDEDFAVGRTIQLQKFGTNMEGNRAFFRPFKSIAVGLNVDIQDNPVSGQLRFENLYFSGYAVDGSASTGYIALRCVDFPMIDSTMSQCWFNLSVNETVCILGRFFYFKVSDTTFEISHRGIVTSGDTPATSVTNGLSVVNSTFYFMWSKCFDFSNAELTQRVMLSNIIYTSRNSGGFAQFIDAVNSKIQMTNLEIRHVIGTTSPTAQQVMQFFGGCEVWMNNVVCRTDNNERPADTVLGRWLNVEESVVRMSNSFFSGCNGHMIQLRNGASMFADSCEFRGSSQYMLLIPDGANGVNFVMNGGATRRHKFGVVQDLASASGVVMEFNFVIFDDAAFGNGTGGDIYTALNWASNHRVDLLWPIFRRSAASDIAYHIAANRPCVLNGFRVEGSKPAYNTAIEIAAFQSVGPEVVL